MTTLWRSTTASLRAQAGLEISGCQSVHVSALGFSDDCLGKWMFGVEFHGSSSRNQILFGNARCCHHVRNRWRTACQGSGLIENHDVQIARTFECESVLNKKSVLSAERC